MFCTVQSLGVMGIDAFEVMVEADLSRGLPSFEIVGLPDTAVRESRDRVRAALLNNGFDFPTGKVLVNLAPANLRKSGPLYDLPVLLGLLISSGQLPYWDETAAYVGELSLSGALKGCSGVLSMVLAARQRGMQSIYIPWENAAEGAAIPGIRVYPVKSVGQLMEHFRGGEPILPCGAIPFEQLPCSFENDLAEVKGQETAKLALEIAAAGRHNLLLIGAPGSGKSMLAKRLPTILPELSFEEAVETTRIHSVAGILPAGVSLIRSRPFRSPHHTISPAGLSGGGSPPFPGEISLAHNGVLFLDELPEFSRQALEVLRQPMEDGRITISRAASRLTYPCSVMVVAAMNPCPCGYFGHPTRKCSCSPFRVNQYLSRISGPLLDRIDLQVEVMPVDFGHLSSSAPGESSLAVRQRVEAARKLQDARREALHLSGRYNARLSANDMSVTCQLTGQARAMLQNAFERMGLSARSYDRILKISRTIADLDGSEQIGTSHIAQALQFRGLDRKYWTAQGSR